ncbi:MAG: hypothetical protein ABJ360_09765, partial [Roseobacter sp.]
MGPVATTFAISNFAGALTLWSQRKSGLMGRVAAKVTLDQCPDWAVSGDGPVHLLRRNARCVTASPHQAQGSSYDFLSIEALFTNPIMKKTMRFILISFALALDTSAQAEPVDLTGLTCVRMTNFGPNAWEFYGDIAVRRYAQGQGRPQRFVRVGEGAYERYSRI